MGVLIPSLKLSCCMYICIQNEGYLGIIQLILGKSRLVKPLNLVKGASWGPPRLLHRIVCKCSLGTLI